MNLSLLHRKHILGSRLNQNNIIPEGAVKFEGTDEYVVFENGGELIYVVFEPSVPEGALMFEGTETFATFDNGEFIIFE